MLLLPSISFRGWLEEVRKWEKLNRFAHFVKPRNNLTEVVKKKKKKVTAI